MVCTRFYDLHSGGKQKTDFPVIFIDGAEELATKRFRRLFKRDPRNITCQCCGADYSISEYETFEEAIKHELGMSCAVFREEYFSE